MGVDIVQACSVSCGWYSTQSFFITMICIFAFYIGLDVVVAMCAVGAKVSELMKSEARLAAPVAASFDACPASVLRMHVQGMQPVARHDLAGLTRLRHGAAR